MKKKRLSLLLVIAMLLTSLPTAALAADTFTVASTGSSVAGEKNEEAYTTDYTVSEKNVTVTVSGSTANSRVILQQDATLVLDSVSMALDECNGSPIEIAAGTAVTLVLKGQNTVSAYAAGQGILVGQGATLTIRADQSDPAAGLAVSGATMLKYTDGGASGGQTTGFAGIGGPNSGSPLTYTGTINIESRRTKPPAPRSPLCYSNSLPWTLKLFPTEISRGGRQFLGGLLCVAAIRHGY